MIVGRKSSGPARGGGAAVSRRVLVSLYEAPPREELTLEEFECFAVDRLRVLRTIDGPMVLGQPEKIEVRKQTRFSSRSS